MVNALYGLAEAMVHQDRLDEARLLAEQAVDTCARTDTWTFLGPPALAMRALLSDPAGRSHDVEQSDRLLAAGCVEHCGPLALRLLIADALVRGRTDEALARCDQLDAFLADEPQALYTRITRRVREASTAIEWTPAMALRAPIGLTSFPAEEEG